MTRETLRSRVLLVAAAAGTLIVSACSSGVALTSATDSASDSAPAADTSEVATSTTALTTTTVTPTTIPAPVTAPATAPAPATTLPTTLPATLPAEPVGDAAPTTVAPAPAPTVAPTPTVPAPAPATTQSGPCPVVNHNPATTAGCGDATPLVLEVQQKLACVGDPVPEDGVFGPTTYQAVVAYQLFAGLTPDGLAGPSTRAGLSDACFSGDY